MLKILIIITNCYLAHTLTCNDVLDLPDSKRLTLKELQTLQPKDTVQCLAHLGKEQLLKEEADFIWQSIVNYHGGIGNIPDAILVLLHWVTPALTPDDYGNLTLSNIDVIQNFGLNYGLNEDQLSAIADRVREDFAGKEPQDYSFYDLTALRQILCAFNQSEIESIRPLAYKEAAILLGKLENCKAEVMQGFATLAVHPNAFGSPAGWSESTIRVIGKVADYIPQEFINQNNKPNNN